MRMEHIRHEYLRRILNEMASGEDGLKEECFEALFSELKHSGLILAGNLEDDKISLMHAECDSGSYALVFTDMDEFRKARFECEIEANDYLLDIYRIMLPNLGMDGFIINVESEAFIFTNDMFDLIESMPIHKLTSDNPYTSEELKELRDSMDNESIEEFVENPKNIGKYEELFEEMSNSTMLTLMLSHYDLSEMAHDGIIETLENGPVGFMHMENLGGTYATMYTSESKMASIDTPLNKFSQIVNPALMTYFILTDDMDGLIINPNSDNILLTRDVLLEYSSLIQDTCNDPRLNNAIFHMFVMEEEV